MAQLFLPDFAGSSVEAAYCDELVIYLDFLDEGSSYCEVVIHFDKKVVELVRIWLDRDGNENSDPPIYETNFDLNVQETIDGARMGLLLAINWMTKERHKTRSEEVSVLDQNLAMINKEIGP